MGKQFTFFYLEESLHSGHKTQVGEEGVGGGDCIEVQYFGEPQFV